MEYQVKCVLLIQYFVPAKPVISRVCGCGHQRFIPEPWYNFAGAQALASVMALEAFFDIIEDSLTGEYKNEKTQDFF
jgi:hypothetical protein